MNTISFKIQNSLLEDFSVANIYIDHFPLPAILSAYETIAATKLKVPELAGCYDGLPAIITLEHCDHFLGDTITAYRYSGNRVALMDYAHSGIPGDYTAACIITIHKYTVTWSRFKNFSSLFDTGMWRYNDLQFCFDKEQYFAALKAAALSYAC